MPDLLSHFALAYCIATFSGWRRFRVPFYIGTLLPDLLTRPLYILFPSTIFYVYSLHSPSMVFLVCVMTAMLFESSLHRGVLLFLSLGAAFHFILDLLQKQVLTAYYWFFPFSWKTFSIGLFWPEESLRLLPLWIALVFLIEITLQLKKHRSEALRSCEKHASP